MSIAKNDISAEKAVFAYIDAKIIRRPFTVTLLALSQNAMDSQMRGRNRGVAGPFENCRELATLKGLPCVLGVDRSRRRLLISLNKIAWTLV
jgi:hypothetical protein